MLYCRDCGQCSYIGDDNFYEIRNTSGWERVDIDCNSGETVEWGDSEITDSDHCNYECPNCSSENIDGDWDGTNEEAVEVRNTYHETLNRLRNERELRKREMENEKAAKDPNREWDVMTNV